MYHMCFVLKHIVSSTHSRWMGKIFSLWWFNHSLCSKYLPFKNTSYQSHKATAAEWAISFLFHDLIWHIPRYYITRIHNGFVCLKLPSTVFPATYYARQDSDFKYVVPKSTIDVYKFSFFPRIIRMWNHLPGQVIHATGLTTFKETALPIIRSMQPPVGSYVLHIYPTFLLAQRTLFFFL